MSEISDIPAQSGGWLAVPAGRVVRVVDVEGQQIADFFAVSASDNTEWLSADQNFQRAAAEAGWAPPDVPDPVNFFQNTPVGEGGTLSIGVAQSKPGDFVALRAEIDVIVVATACSVDDLLVDGDRCTGIRLALA